MTNDAMHLEDFAAALDRHGGDLTRWPATAADAAGILLASVPQANHLLAQARALDTLLDEAFPAPQTSLDRLRAGILSGLCGNDALSLFVDWIRTGPWLLRPVAVALIPVVLGFGAGIGLSDGAKDAELVTEIQLLAFESQEGYGDAE